MTLWRRIRAFPGVLGRHGVLLIDGILVRRHRVEVFADDPECILRSTVRRLDEPVTLPCPPDGSPAGARLEAGATIIEVHFWNEHLPHIGEKGADLVWARQFALRLSRSLDLLAAHALITPSYARFAAVHGQLGFVQGPEIEVMKRRMGRVGFMLELRSAPGLRFWSGPFWACLYAWWLMWAFNPNTLRGKRFRDTAISDAWMTRDTLLSRLPTTRPDFVPSARR